MLFATAKSYRTYSLFTITYYLPNPRGFSEKWRVKSEKVIPKDKSSGIWLRRWDLNLMTSGLWARRATRLLHSAIWWCRKPGSNRYEKKSHGILSPGRLPIPPFRHIFDRCFPTSLTIISSSAWKVNSFGENNLIMFSTDSDKNHGQSVLRREKILKKHGGVKFFRVYIDFVIVLWYNSIVITFWRR